MGKMASVLRLRAIIFYNVSNGCDIIKDFLERHGVAAQPPGREKIARAMPSAILVAGIVVVVLTTEFHGKL